MTETVAISDDGRLAVVGTGDGAQLLDAADGRVLAATSWNDGDVVTSTTFGADSATVLLGTFGGYLHVLSATDLQPVVPRRLTTGGFLIGLAGSPDGKYVASVGTDGDLLIWDTVSWQPLGRPIADQNGWGSLNFDPDGRTLRALHQDGTVLSFTVDRDAWIRQACAIANRDLTPEESEVVRPGQPERSTCEGYR